MAAIKPHYTIPKLKEQEQFRRWTDSVHTAAEMLGILNYIDIENIDVEKLKEGVATAYSQLKFHILESLSDRLYEIVKGEAVIKNISIATIIGRLTSNFQPKYIFGDLRLRQQLFGLKLADHESLTD